MNKPIHYAACCETSANLEYLVEKGASLFDINMTKMTPLHYAAINGRHENVKFMIQSSPLLVKNRDKAGLTAMAYACQFGSAETILAFIDSGIVKVNAGQGKERLSPLSWAAARGDYDLCVQLLERKGRVLSKDKFKRTPLIMACRNGHVKIASLLLQHGSEWNHCDSSQNSVLHYAAAFGWKECLDLLIEHGADLNKENMWRVTPICIAMLKNHQGIVKEMLKREGVDVNGKDDKGRTLLALACTDLASQGIYEFIQFLLSKGADPNIKNVQGNTVLHNLSVYDLQCAKKDKGERQAEKVTLANTIKLLIDSGADLTIENSEKQTPFTLAL